MRYPYTLSNDSITIFIAGKMRTVLSGNINFDKLKEHLKGTDHDEATILRLSDREHSIRSSSVGTKVEVRNGVVYYNGEEIHNALTTKLLNLLDDGFDASPWIKFLEKLMDNPSYRSRECLYEFLDHFQAPITPDGKFIAFKRVRKDWLDIHSGTIKNEIGTTVRMDRAKVDDDPKRTCSSGLHVCADEYLKGYHSGDGYRTLVVEVSPADVVAVPYDYNFSKMRVCEYTVLAEISEEQIPETLSNKVYDTKQQQGRDPKTGRFLKK